MSPHCSEQLPPIKKESCQTQRHQEDREISLVKKSEPGEQTEKERIPQFALLVPTDCEIKAGASANETRDGCAPVEHGKKKIRRIESEQCTRDQRRCQTKPAPRAEHEKKERDRSPESRGRSKHGQGRAEEPE